MTRASLARIAASTLAALTLASPGCGSHTAPPSPPPTNLAERPPPPARPDSTLPDRDHDGIPDERDRCPDEPEDYDLYADDDGCPDPDNDGDGVPDAVDECPYDFGSNADGCPKECKTIVISSDDCFLDPSVFIVHGAPQRERLDVIAKLVADHPTVQELVAHGTHAAEVATQLRARMPRFAITVDATPEYRPDVVFVTISKQRFDAGRFRASECTPFGAIYTPARPDNCAQ